MAHGSPARCARTPLHYRNECGVFGWKDARSDTARDLADKFVRRFPEVAADGLGSDWEYAGWYVEMLGHAEAGHLPIGYADWYEQPPLDSLPTLGDDPRRRPMPPGGDGEDSVAE